jgi:hypothetical protein
MGSRRTIVARAFALLALRLLTLFSLRPLALFSAAALLLAGCNLNYLEGQTREAQNRWEEAAIQYHLALIKSPDDKEYQAAYTRARLQVARDNLARYKKYLADKEFTKAYLRLIDASRQDPSLQEVKDELAKWTRVLVTGQVKLDFSTPQSVTTVADEIRLAIRFNTPNPGEVAEAEIDVDTGVFFVEGLLYDRPDELLTYYSINSIGLSLVQGKTLVKKFTSRDFVRFINYRTPVLDASPNAMRFTANDKLTPIAEQRQRLPKDEGTPMTWAPKANPRYRMALQGNQILVSSPDGRSDFTPRFLYINKQDRRLLVDFGRYEVKLDDDTRRWGLRRLPVSENDYFPLLLQNIALQPYFYYRDAVLAYQPTGAG